MSWLARDLALAKAKQIIDRNPQRPYWLSIPFDHGNPPITGYYPCTMFRTRDRAYYGFLFREHRESAISLLTDARREYVTRVRKIAPQLVH